MNPGRHMNDPLRVGASATVIVDTLSSTMASSDAMAGHNKAQR
jgi:hypothetical protein